MPTANPSDLLDKAPPRLRDPLLQPFRLKGLSLRNRIMSTSHAATIEEPPNMVSAMPPLAFSSW